ncbi:MAG: hypothetical protein WAM73_08105 [Desulfobacterales bacterium]
MAKFNLKAWARVMILYPDNTDLAENESAVFMPASTVLLWGETEKSLLPVKNPLTVNLKYNIGLKTSY